MRLLDCLWSSSPPRVLVLAAHPDDETLGAGALLGHLADHGARLTIVHLTDGAPRNPWFWHQAGVGTRRDYARLRAGELCAALDAGHVHAELVALGCPDQEAARALAPLTRAVTALIDDERPEVLMTHAYEGGHPDHDAAAFVAAAAARSCTGPPPLLVEMALYHEHGGALRTGEFLDDRGVLSHPLDDEARARKQAMLEAYRSQREVLARFGTATLVERLRRAPAYNFAAAPHPPPLHYERFDWPLDGARFRELAAEALVELGLARRHTVVV